MKVAELLTEAAYTLKYKVAVRLVNDLIRLAQEYRDGAAALAGTSIEETPVPFAVYNARTPISEFPPLVSVIRNSNISDTMWEEASDQIIDFLRDGGYVDGIMPVDVQIARKNDGTIWLEVT